MRKGLILLFLAAGISFCLLAVNPVCAQSTPSAIPSREEFVNQVFHVFVDSSFSAYYLSADAAPCSFVKYNYDEWIKYALQEDVPIYLLNELAGKAYDDRRPGRWRQDSLAKARCIDEEQIGPRLDPAFGLRSDTSMGDRKRQRAIRRRYAAWNRLPAEQRTVFYFSRPAFTDDGQYAVLDMSYRCDNRQCGEGSTCLFRRMDSGWKLIGKRVRWGG
jgi:hypothetical protein